MSSHDGRESAHVEVTVASGGSFTLVLSGIHDGRQGEIDVVFATNKFVYGQTCFDAGPRTDIGVLSAEGTQSFSLLPDFATTDPSYLHSVILSDGTPDSTKCLANAVGAANLSWTIPNLRPDLRALDGGSRAGATGKTTLTGGVLTGYVSAKGDQVTAIARRFGLTVPDLLFLNPNALQEAGDVAVAPGSRVNLATSTR